MSQIKYSILSRTQLHHTLEYHPRANLFFFLSIKEKMENKYQTIGYIQN